MNAGSPGRFYCGDGYDLGGTIVGANNFTNATPKEVRGRAAQPPRDLGFCLGRLAGIRGDACGPRVTRNARASLRAQTAAYCADLCTSQSACHAFTVTGSLCVRKSRNSTSFAGDAVRANVTVGCFKYGLLWDMLGAHVAVQVRRQAPLPLRPRSPAVAACVWALQNALC